MTKKYNDIDPNQPATYKQSWAVAYHFAKQSPRIHPQFSERKLANLIRGTIYYYHKDKGENLTHRLVQEYLNSKNPLPDIYQESLKKYIEENKVEGDAKKSNHNDGNLLTPGEW